LLKATYHVIPTKQTACAVQTKKNQPVYQMGCVCGLETSALTVVVVPTHHGRRVPAFRHVVTVSGSEKPSIGIKITFYIGPNDEHADVTQWYLLLEPKQYTYSNMRDTNRHS
jgi:hypothetical protein